MSALDEPSAKRHRADPQTHKNDAAADADESSSSPGSPAQREPSKIGSETPCDIRESERNVFAAQTILRSMIGKAISVVEQAEEQECCTPAYQSESDLQQAQCHGKEMVESLRKAAEATGSGSGQARYSAWLDLEEVVASAGARLEHLDKGFTAVNEKSQLHSGDTHGRRRCAVQARALQGIAEAALIGRIILARQTLGTLVDLGYEPFPDFVHDGGFPVHGAEKALGMTDRTPPMQRALRQPGDEAFATEVPAENPAHASNIPKETDDTRVRRNEAEVVIPQRALLGQADPESRESLNGVRRHEEGDGDALAAQSAIPGASGATVEYKGVRMPTMRAAQVAKEDYEIGMTTAAAVLVLADTPLDADGPGFALASIPLGGAWLGDPLLWPIFAVQTLQVTVQSMLQGTPNVKARFQSWAEGLRTAAAGRSAALDGALSKVLNGFTDIVPFGTIITPAATRKAPVKTPPPRLGADFIEVAVALLGKMEASRYVYHKDTIKYNRVRQLKLDKKRSADATWVEIPTQLEGIILAYLHAQWYILQARKACLEECGRKGRAVVSLLQGLAVTFQTQYAEGMCKIDPKTRKPDGEAWCPVRRAMWATVIPDPDTWAAMAPDDARRVKHAEAVPELAHMYPGFSYDAERKARAGGQSKNPTTASHHPSVQDAPYLMSPLSAVAWYGDKGDLLGQAKQMAPELLPEGWPADPEEGWMRAAAAMREQWADDAARELLAPGHDYIMEEFLKEHELHADTRALEHLVNHSRSTKQLGAAGATWATRLFGAKAATRDGSSPDTETDPLFTKGSARADLAEFSKAEEEFFSCLPAKTSPQYGTQAAAMAAKQDHWTTRQPARAAWDQLARAADPDAISNAADEILIREGKSHRALLRAGAAQVQWKTLRLDRAGDFLLNVIKAHSGPAQAREYADPAGGIRMGGTTARTTGHTAAFKAYAIQKFRMSEDALLRVINEQLRELGPTDEWDKPHFAGISRDPASRRITGCLQKLAKDAPKQRPRRASELGGSLSKWSRGFASPRWPSAFHEFSIPAPGTIGTTEHLHRMGGERALQMTSGQILLEGRVRLGGIRDRIRELSRPHAPAWIIEFFLPAA